MSISRPVGPAWLVVAFVAGGVLTLVLIDRMLRLQYTPEWVGAGASVLSFLATAALAWFAGVQIWAERRKRASERRSADARLSAAAFEIRKPLVDWIIRSQDKGWSSPKIAQDAHRLAAEVLPRLAEELAASAAASPQVAAHLRTAYANCQSAAVKVESYLGQYHDATEAQLRGADPNAYAALLADGALLSDGRENFRGCCNELERLVEPVLLAEAKRLGAWRPV